MLLVNCAGCGYLGLLGETDTALETRMVDLNVRALTAVTNLVIPFMAAGGHILNVSSIASFCPNPRDDGLLRIQGVCFLLYRGPFRGTAAQAHFCDCRLSGAHADGVFGRGQHHGEVPYL